MKLKKVKIQAFRAYNKVEDGTFDFSVSKDQDADFVSLYAPNGFGKTSFYDAVEYAITNTISRFTRSKLNDDASKSQKDASKEEKQFILRNKFSSEELDSYIEVYTTDSNTPEWRRPIKKPRKGSRDFSFDANVGEHKHFTEVVLAQEWIDAFLMGDNAEDRYSKFVKYFGDKDLDEYYKKLLDLEATNDKEIVRLKKEINSLQKDLDFKGDKDLLSNVNAHIASLIGAGEFLPLLDEKFNDANSLELANLISKRLSYFESENKSKNGRLSELDSIEVGAKRRPALSTYFSERVMREQILKEQSEITAILKMMLSLDKYKNRELSALDSQKKLEAQRKLHQSILLLLDDYLIILTDKQKLQSESKKLGNQINEIEKSRNEEVLRETEKAFQVDQRTEQLDSLQEEMMKLPLLLKKFDSDQTKLEDLQKKLVSLSEILKTSSEEKDRTLIALAEYKNAIVKLADFKFPDVNLDIFTEFDQRLSTLQACLNRVNAFRKKQSEINTQIKQQEDFNKTIREFISKGAEIVDSTQSSNCPLCNFEYKSFQELSDRIARNNLLSEILKKLLSDRSLIERKFKAEEAKLHKDKDQVVKLLDSKCKTLETRLTGLERSISKETLEIRAIEREIKVINQDLKRIKKMFQGRSYEVYLKERNNQLYEVKLELSSLEQQQLESKKLVRKITSEKNVAEKKLKLVNDAIQKLLTNKKYKRVQDFLDNRYPNAKNQVDLFNAELRTFETKLGEVNKDIEKIHSELTQISKSTNDYKQSSLEKRLQSLINSMKKIEVNKVEFEQFIKKVLGLKNVNFSQEDLRRKIQKQKELIKAELLSGDVILKQYLLLVELRKNVEPFLRYQKAKRTESELNKRKAYLEQSIQVFLETERKKVTEHLDIQINSFFYEDLINDLYKRIDPHPDYKRIKFICDFSDDKPRLNVCLYTADSEKDPIVPNLYFSTAQLNILSLSIFLAKALNAKDEQGNAINCIFIDDPIQSMDSINILSTIDLLRSIVKNKGKQIILSTHDQNFHNLLKKKMPPLYFNSKFLELETFGKVKEDIIS